LEQGESAELARTLRDISAAYGEIARLQRMQRIVWPEDGATLH
jgi:hypothetical protein